MLQANSDVYTLSTGQYLPEFRGSEVAPLGLLDPEDADNKHLPN
jgi:hypothetical protein